jgi:hypothetical protein
MTSLAQWGLESIVTTMASPPCRIYPQPVDLLNLSLCLFVREEAGRVFSFNQLWSQVISVSKPNERSLFQISTVHGTTLLFTRFYQKVQVWSPKRW